MEKFVPVLETESKQLREYFNSEFDDVMRPSEFFQIELTTDLKSDFILYVQLTNLQATFSNKAWIAFSKLENKQCAHHETPKILEILSNIALDYFNEFFSHDREIYLKPNFEAKKINGFNVSLKGEIRNPQLESEADRLLATHEVGASKKNV